MTAATTSAVHGSARGRTAPHAATTTLAARQLRRGALLVGGLCAGLTGLVASQYATVVADLETLVSLERLAENPAIATLFGQPRALGDVGGFTVWRTGTVMAVLLGAWALTAATRVTRGEEDAGRWTLLVSGPVTVRSVVARHLVVLLAVQAAVGAGVAGALAAAGADPGGALLHGAGIGAVGAFFAACGVLAAQVLPDRRTAVAAAAGVLLTSLLLRMVADGVGALSWLAWATPLGQLARTHPFSGNDAVPLAVLVVAVLGVAAAAVAAAAHRDLGEGLVRLHRDRPPRTRLLTSLPSFAVRRALGPMRTWGAALAAYFLLIGLLARSLTTFLEQNEQFARLAAEAGFADLGTVEGYVASLFSLLAVPLGLFAASRVAADAADEEARRLTTVLALPVSRARWLLVHAAVALAGVVVLALGAGAAAWTGAALVQDRLSPVEAAAGVLNVVPVAALGLGAAVLAYGVSPRHVLLAGAVPLVGGYLLLVLADSFRWERVREISPFAHLASVPATGPDLAPTVVMLVSAAAAVAAGAWLFGRRDVAT